MALRRPPTRVELKADNDIDEYTKVNNNNVVMDFEMLSFVFVFPFIQLFLNIPLYIRVSHQ